VGSNAFEPGAGFEAKRGYDAPTGLGTPNVGNLIWFIKTGLQRGAEILHPLYEPLPNFSDHLG
jgi:hypothetical protein